MSKTITIVECKKCGAEYFANDSGIKLEPCETVSFITKRVACCVNCRQKEDRTIARPGKRFQRP